MNDKNKIDRNNIENIMELTSMQQGILFYYISDEYGTCYHEQISLTIKGDINVELLQSSWNYVIDNNEALRTVFRWEEINNPIQIVLKEHKVLIEYKDLTKEIDKYRKIEDIKESDLRNRIDIKNETLRIYLCKIEEHKYYMIVSNHHILYDGWSNGIILKELIDTYNDLYENRKVKKSQKAKFSKFIKYNKNHNKKEQEEYWTEYLSDVNIKRHLFSCIKKSNLNKDARYRLNNDKTEKIKEFAKENKISLASILYSAWGIVTQKINNTDSVMFGTTVSGRNIDIESVDNIVGLFINTIPLVIKKEKDCKLIDLIKNTEKTLVERKDYENTSLIDIKRYYGVKARENFFDSIVSIENYPVYLRSNKKNILTIEEYSTIGNTNYTVTLEILTFDSLEIIFKYNSLALDEQLVNKLANYFVKILDILLHNKNIEIKDIEIITVQEKEELLCNFNDTKEKYPKDKTIHELFEEQVEKTPEKIAVVYEDKKLTYKELNEKSNQLARVLRAKGVKADSIVGIMVERSLEMIIGIMAILKAGGAYLPIDPLYPEERKKFIIKDSNAKILLIQEKYMLNSITYVENINLQNKDIYNEEKKNNLQKNSNSTNLVYIIYTSGSTGKPKGVMIEHKSVLNTLTFMEKRYPVLLDDAYLLKTTYTFDVSVTELFGWFMGSGKLVILGKDEERDILEIVLAIQKYKITHINFVPSMINLFNEIVENDIEKINSIKYIFVAGEKIKVNMINNFLKEARNIKIENIYGPTEATIYTSIYTIDKKIKYEDIPIGKPISNTKVYILDKENNMQPIGVVGELCISGDGLARGYLNREKLTKEKFVDNPYNHDEKMYKTGDLARWLPDGNIEFIGRKDDQVKIRGYRIELGEIENRLINHEKIKEAVVISKEDKENNKYLCGYFVSDRNLTGIEIREYLLKQLPNYMIPSNFMKIKKMPLTSNGKIDRKELMKLGEEIEIGTKYEAPRNETEIKVANIWKEVLDIEKISINDDFFQLGGDSIIAIKIVNKSRNQLGVKISIKFLFDNSNIKKFAKEVLKLEKMQLIELKNIQEKDYYPLSYNQKRLWIIQELNPGSIAYNISGKIVFDYKIDKDIVKKSIEKLIDRHKSLRTGFKKIRGEMVQFVAKNKVIPFEFIDISNSIDNRYIKEKIKKHIETEFDLSDPPLIRTILVKKEEDVFELILNIHHIVCDGWSLEILKREFYEIYNTYVRNGNLELKDIQFDYTDFAEWQKNIVNNNILKEETVQFWKKKFKSGIQTLNLPYDNIQNEHKLKIGEHICCLGNLKKEKITELSQKNKTSKFMIMFSVYNLILSQLSAQNEITCNVINAGRESEKLHDVVGFFVNSIIIKTVIDYEEEYKSFLNRLTNECVQAFEYSLYPIELVLQEFGMSYPNINVSFNMLNILKDNRDDSSTLNVDVEREGKDDITLEVIENDNGLKLKWIYKKHLFMPETIEYIADMYVNMLTAIIESQVNY